MAATISCLPPLVAPLLLLVSIVQLTSGHFQPTNYQQAYQNYPQQPQQHLPPPQYVPPQQHPQQFQQPGVQVQHVPVQQQHPPPQMQHPQHAQNMQVPGQANTNILHDQARIHDKEHIKEHLGGVISEPDLSKMSEEELQFHYFKMHDSDGNNMLDGSELIKSLIHWHVEESKNLGANAPPAGTTKIFTDGELAVMIDPILSVDDKNKDGFIDYPEFIAAQKSRGF